MRIFLFEYFTGGGTWIRDDATVLSSSFVREGAAMVSALADDLLRLKNVHVLLLSDARLMELVDTLGVADSTKSIHFRELGNPTVQPPSVAQRHCVVETIASRDAFWTAFDNAIRDCDATILIAPECDGILLDFAQRVSSAGGKLLSPGVDFIRVAADKNATAGKLDVLGARRSPGFSASDFLAGRLNELNAPFVVKPSDGSGSDNIRLIPEHSLVSEFCSILKSPSRWRVESFCPGLPASIAILCGSGHTAVLQPCRQELSSDFQYLGGALLNDPGLIQRSRALIEPLRSWFAMTVGYVGVDFVFGAIDDGSEDRIVEINPRLTTSYAGLRASAKGNIAAWWIELAHGRPVAPEFLRRDLWFDAAGRLSPSGQNTPAELPRAGRTREAPASWPRG